MEGSGYADFGFLWEHGEVRSRIECPFHQDGNASLGGSFRNYLWSCGLPCAVGQHLDLQHPQEHGDCGWGVERIRSLDSTLITPKSSLFAEAAQICCISCRIFAEEIHLFS